MNKLLPILLVVLLSGCAVHTKHFAIAETKYNNLNGENNLEELLDVRNQCSKELGGDYACGSFYNCLRTKGWDSNTQLPFGYFGDDGIARDGLNPKWIGILIPSKYSTVCDRFRH
ncbi:MAG: hypothetical protein L7V30_02310 [Gammaproteobacteria bacterium]|jgi:hypothetical protein|nr:hypothetical protein [Gammaproteobacteria bacterium]